MDGNELKKTGSLINNPVLNLTTTITNNTNLRM